MKIICTHFNATPASCPKCHENVNYSASNAAHMSKQKTRKETVSTSKLAKSGIGDVMNDAQIKTGLKLSEAIKLLEENEGALIRNEMSDDSCFHSSLLYSIRVDTTWSVKLPPQKSVSVTWDFVDKVLDDLRNQYINGEARAEIREKLGL